MYILLACALCCQTYTTRENLDYLAEQQALYKKIYDPPPPTNEDEIFGDIPYRPRLTPASPSWQTPAAIIAAGALLGIGLMGAAWISSRKALPRAPIQASAGNDPPGVAPPPPS